MKAFNDSERTLKLITIKSLITLKKLKLIIIEKQTKNLIN